MAAVLNLIPINDSPLTTLQKNYSLYQGSGDIWVIRNQEVKAYYGGSPKPPEFIKRPAARLLMQRDLESLSFPCKPKEVIDAFFTDPATTIYGDIAFSPTPITGGSTLNLWRPPPLRPKRGNWRVIREHLLDVICDGDRAHFSYLLKYLAHMLQYPEEKPGVMVVLLGGQGTGKGALFQILSRIWSHSVLLVSDIEQVTGRFNAVLSRSYVVCMDEALFSGDRRSQDRIKSLITEPRITVEEKHQPQRSISSFHRFFAASNHKHFAQIDNDDRRCLVLKVSDRHQQDEGYFTRLFNGVDSDDTIAAFMYVLIKMDLKGEGKRFNPRVAPRTNAHVEQRLLSLTRFEKYWHHVLWVGELPEFDHYTQTWQESIFIPSEKLALAAARFDPISTRYSRITGQEISRELSRLCPSAQQTRKGTDGLGGPRRGYDMPSLEVARAEFEAAKGFKVLWEEEPNYCQALPLNARASGRLKPNSSMGFKEFTRLTRHFDIYSKNRRK